MHSTHELIFGGKFFACLAANWQATGSFFVFFCVCFFGVQWLLKCCVVTELILFSELYT